MIDAVSHVPFRAKRRHSAGLVIVPSTLLRAQKLEL